MVRDIKYNGTTSTYFNACDALFDDPNHLVQKVWKATASKGRFLPEERHSFDFARFHPVQNPRLRSSECDPRLDSSAVGILDQILLIDSQSDKSRHHPTKRSLKTTR